MTDDATTREETSLAKGPEIAVGEGKGLLTHADSLEMVTRERTGPPRGYREHAQTQ